MDLYSRIVTCGHYVYERSSIHSLFLKQLLNDTTERRNFFFVLLVFSLKTAGSKSLRKNIFLMDIPMTIQRAFHTYRALIENIFDLCAAFTHIYLVHEGFQLVNTKQVKTSFFCKIIVLFRNQLNCNRFGKEKQIRLIGITNAMDIHFEYTSTSIVVMEHAFFEVRSFLCYIQLFFSMSRVVV